MSQENVDLVRASFDAWDEGGVTAWAALLAPDVVWRFPLGWPKPGPYFGRDNVLRVLQQQRDTWDFTDTADPTVSYLDAGNRVVVRFVWGDGEQGSDLDLDVTCVFNVRDRRSAKPSSSGITPKLSKPWGCRSRRAASFTPRSRWDLR